MTHVVQVPPGFSSRVLRSSLPLGVLGLYATSLGLWSVVVCATPDRISLLFADSWVAGMVRSGYHVVLEELDWVGHHAERRNTVFCHPEGLPLVEAVLGDLRGEFDVVPLPLEVTGIYAGFTNQGFQVTPLKEESLGFPIAVHPLVQPLVAVHKIDVEVLRVCKLKEHVMFTGLWWSPFGKERLTPSLAHVEEAEAAMWAALRPEWGTMELLEHLQPLIAKCVETRGTIGVPEGERGVRYLAQSAVDSVNQYLKGYDAGAIFVADMREAMATWDTMRVPEDEELYAQLQSALQDPATAYAVCSGVVFARRHGLPPPPSVAGPAVNGAEEPPAGTAPSPLPLASEAEPDPTGLSATPSTPVATTLGAEPNVVSALAKALHEEDDESSYYALHLRVELQHLAAKQHVLQMYRQKQEVMLQQKVHVAKVYATSMRDFQLGDYHSSKEGFFECLRLGTFYLTGADPELSSAYYNAGRALHLAGVLGPAKEVLKTCLQLRSEQLRHGLIDQSLIDKTKQALQQCLQDCHNAAKAPA